MSYYRSLSALESTYVAINKQHNTSFINQIFIEGKGHLDPHKWQRAIALASKQNVGSHLRLKGIWGWRYWDSEGKNPQLHVVEHDDWDGMGTKGMNFAQQGMDVRKDSLAEVWLLPGTTPRILFRTHHAIMDGMGTIFWIQEIFRALNRQTLLSADGRWTETTIAKQQKHPKYTFQVDKSASPLQKKANRTLRRGCHWRRIEIPGISSKIIPRFIQAIAEYIREKQLDKRVDRICMRVPADLRRYLSTEDAKSYSLGNCTSLIDLDISVEDDVQSIHKKILRAMRNKEDIGFVTQTALQLIKWMPGFMVRPAIYPGDKTLNTIYDKENYPFTANISYIGKQEIKHYSDGDFTATAIFGIPIALENRPLFIGISTIEKNTHATISAPYSLISEAELEKFCQELITRIVAL